VRLGDDPVADELVKSARDNRREQGARVGLEEPAERQIRQADQLTLIARLANGEHHRDGLAQQPSSNESEYLARGLIEPLRVLHHAEQWPLVGDLSQEAQRGEGDEEAVRSVTRRESERDLHGTLLWLGERTEVGQHRRAELVHSCVRQLHLRLDSRDLGDSKP